MVPRGDDAQVNDWVELGELQRLIRTALREDLAAGDVTSRLVVPADRQATATLVAKSALVVCGIQVAAGVFGAVDERVETQTVVADATRVDPGCVLLRVRGAARSLLAAERTALNLLQRMCGVATYTRQFVDAAAGGCRIVDTRKTMPGLRAIDRYAVRCGGGFNHRNDLGSGILIKENHIRCGGGIAAAVAAAKHGAPHGQRVQCEVTTLAELALALDAGADAVLLDNMDDDTIAQAVTLVAGRAWVEVSGGVQLERVDRLARLGVDLVSVGALTHSAVAADISLLFETSTPVEHA